MSDDGIVEKSETLKSAETAMRRWGMPEPAQPTHDDNGEIPLWPNNVADLELDDIARHMTWLTGWVAYATHNLGRAKTNHAGFEEGMAHARSKFLFSSGIGANGDYATVTEAKAAFDQRPDTVRIKKKVLEAKALVTMLESLIKGYEEKRFTLSRELTKRGIDEARGGQRGDRFNA